MRRVIVGLLLGAALTVLVGGAALADRGGIVGTDSVSRP